jgi:hypothetical protein
MLARQVPSSDMLHSVGALMDTSFLRAAVADANEESEPHPAGSENGHPHAWVWIQATLARFAKIGR